MTATKVYTPLSQLPAVKITNCSAILPNHMCCWRAGDVQVIRQLVTEATAEEPVKVENQEYQLCNRHAYIEQQQDAIDAQKAEVEAEQPAQQPEKK